MAARPTVREVVETLGSEGLLEGEVGAIEAAIAAHKERDEAPFYVRALIGFGAWVASICFLGFIALISLFESSLSRGALGLILAAGAAVLRRLSSGPFATQLALSLGMAGRAAFYSSFEHALHGTSGLAVLVAFGEAINVLAFPDRVSRFVSSFVAVCALYVALLDADASMLLREGSLVALAAATAALWLRKSAAITSPLGALVEPLAHALFAALFVLTAVESKMGFDWHDHSASPYRGVAASLGLVALLVQASVSIAGEVRASRRSLLAAIAGVLAVGLITCRVPGVTAAALGLALGFHRRSPQLVGLSAASLIAFGVFFYYQLSLTLLVKSIMLVASGAVLLSLRAAFTRHAPEPRP